MKKIKYIIGTFLGLSSIGIIAPISTSCSAKSTTQTTNKDYVKEINDAQKHLITEQSAIDLNSLFSKNILNRSNNGEITKLSRDDIASKIVIDENNLIYQKLKDNNLNKKFEEEAIDVVYESYLNELNEINRIGINSKHGLFFSSHFWKAVGFKLAGASLFALSFIWWGAQLAPAIVSFIKNYDVSGFIGFTVDLPDFVYKLVTLTITKIKQFKESTNCTWKFKVWKGTSYDFIITI